MKTETIDFKTFMKRKNPVRPIAEIPDWQRYSLHISPMAFVDTRFVTFAAAILAFALLEKHLINFGFGELVRKIDTILRIGFPLVFASMLLYFLIKNPFF